eukprot:CAMPEP_0197056200 /NCGR_PEP_ID=MMETSP1384-20130603/80509_1 /TAXON_ID=29189 /ORGANISM="Ammonia sp." /LENGTH=172 /DNA_ID=CAMNT_0042490091 /DNA_START=111 /DNA_END=629 /DNA_ORIENTATION=+
MTPEQRFRRKARRTCCCLTFLLVLNTLMLLWVSSRTSFLEWYLASPDNQMMVEMEQPTTFCEDMCANLKCGELPCDATQASQMQCQTQCFAVMQSKLPVFRYSDNDSDEDEEALQAEQGEGGRHHGGDHDHRGRHHSHDGGRSHSHSGSRSHDGGRRAHGKHQRHRMHMHMH